VSDGALAGWLRTAVAPRALAPRCARSGRGGWPSARSRRSASATEEPLSQTLPGIRGWIARVGPAAGDRFPWLQTRLHKRRPPEDLFARLDDTRFTLLLFGQPVPAAELAHRGRASRAHTLPDDPANAASSIVLASGAILLAAAARRPHRAGRRPIRQERLDGYLEGGSGRDEFPARCRSAPGPDR
jgi:hypothetical protein